MKYHANKLNQSSHLQILRILMLTSFLIPKGCNYYRNGKTKFVKPRRGDMSKNNFTPSGFRSHINLALLQSFQPFGLLSKIYVNLIVGFYEFDSN